MKKRILIKELLLILVTMIWGFGFITQSVGGSYLDVNSFNFCRNLLASICLFVACIINRKTHLKMGKPLPISNKKHLIRDGILIGLALTAGMTLQQIGINLEGAGKSGFLTALYIVMIPVIRLFFGKKVSPVILVALVIALTGVYLININGEQFTFTWGAVALILSALAYSVQIMLIDKFSPNYDTIELSFMEFTTASVVMLPIFLLFGSFTWEGLTSALPSILYLGLGSSCIAYTLQIYAQSEVPVTIAAIIMGMESVFSLIFGVIFLKETHSIVNYIGCTCIFVAVLLSQIQFTTKKEKEPKINS